MSEAKRDIDVLGQLGPLRRYALSLTRDPADAEDLVHNALVRAMERRDQFRRGANLRVWLMSILHNRFIDRVRSRRLEQVRDAEIEMTAEQASAAGQEASVRLAELREAFLSLPDEQRAALHLVSIEGLSYEEAAAALSIPVGTLVSRISRARERLRDIENGSTNSNVVAFKGGGGSHANRA